MTDKRVFDIKLNANEHGAWRTISVSADATLRDLHKTIQGAFGTFEATTFRFVLNGVAFVEPKGSRTPLRRLLDEGGRFEYDGDVRGSRHYSALVTRSYTVQNRRHFPKVPEGEGTVCGGRDYDARLSTYDAQGMVRDEIPLASEVSEGSLADLLYSVNPQGLLAGSEERIAGFFTALAVGPMLMPSAWTPMLFGEMEWQSLDLAQDAMTLAIEAYNNIVGELAHGLVRADLFGAEWALGFMLAVILASDAWKALGDRDPDLQPAMEPIGRLAQGEQYKDSQLLTSIFRIGECWRNQPPYGVAQTPFRRTQAKVSPNAPCPCGSGKKYKRCCSPLRAV